MLKFCIHFNVIRGISGRSNRRQSGEGLGQNWGGGCAHSCPSQKSSLGSSVGLDRRSGAYQLASDTAAIRISSQRRHHTKRCRQLSFRAAGPLLCRRIVAAAVSCGWTHHFSRSRVAIQYITISRVLGYNIIRHNARRLLLILPRIPHIASCIVRGHFVTSSCL